MEVIPLLSAHRRALIHGRSAHVASQINCRSDYQTRTAPAEGVHRTDTITVRPRGPIRFIGLLWTGRRGARSSAMRPLYGACGGSVNPIAWASLSRWVSVRAISDIQNRFFRACAI